MDPIHPKEEPQTNLTIHSVEPQTDLTLPLGGSRGANGKSIIYQLHPSWTTLSKNEPCLPFPPHRSSSPPIPEGG